MIEAPESPSFGSVRGCGTDGATRSEKDSLSKTKKRMKPKTRTSGSAERRRSAVAPNARRKNG